ncbi:MAG: hypothetical protein AABZ47_07910 [Planctomycetota bacterium]
MNKSKTIPPTRRRGGETGGEQAQQPGSPAAIATLRALTEWVMALRSRGEIAANGLMVKRFPTQADRIVRLREMIETHDKGDREEALKFLEKALHLCGNASGEAGRGSWFATWIPKRWERMLQAFIEEFKRTLAPIRMRVDAPQMGEKTDCVFRARWRETA